MLFAATYYEGEVESWLDLGKNEDGLVACGWEAKRLLKFSLQFPRRVESGAILYAKGDGTGNCSGKTEGCLIAR